MKELLASLSLDWQLVQEIRRRNDAIVREELRTDPAASVSGSLIIKTSTIITLLQSTPSQ